MVGIVLDEGAAFALSGSSDAPLQANTFMLLCPECFQHYSDLWPSLQSSTMLNLKASTTQMTMRNYKCDKCHSELHGVYELRGQRMAMCLNPNSTHRVRFDKLADVDDDDIFGL